MLMLVTWQPDSYHSCLTRLHRGSLEDTCLTWYLCHFHHRKLINEEVWLQAAQTSSLRTFTRSHTWQPETGKALCVTAVRGTDQISRSTLNCLRSAEIKGEKSPFCCTVTCFLTTLSPECISAKTPDCSRNNELSLVRLF